MLRVGFELCTRGLG